jgi:hypothetical protein
MFFVWDILAAWTIVLRIPTGCADDLPTNLRITNQYTTSRGVNSFLRWLDLAPNSRTYSRASQSIWTCPDLKTYLWAHPN